MRVNSASSQIGLSQVSPSQLCPVCPILPTIFPAIFIRDTSMRCVLYIKMFSKNLREYCLVLSILLVCQSCFTQRVWLHNGRNNKENVAADRQNSNKNFRRCGQYIYIYTELSETQCRRIGTHVFSLGRMFSARQEFRVRMGQKSSS